jgi:hypothetical protein
MVRGGDSPRDYRSEAERVKARSDMPSFETEYHRGKRAPSRVEDSHPQRFEEADAQGFSEQKLWSDQTIRQKVVDTLGMEPWIATSDVAVEVEGGVVLLTGSVDTINTKYRAAEIAKRFAGVEQVDNQLKIRVGDALDEFTRGVEQIRPRIVSRSPFPGRGSESS